MFDPTPPPRRLDFVDGPQDLDIDIDSDDELADANDGFEEIDGGYLKDAMEKDD